MKKMCLQIALAASMVFTSVMGLSFEAGAQTVSETPAVSAAAETKPAAESKNPEENFHQHWHREHKPEHIVVPIAFFIFLIVMILGSRAFRERTEQRRLGLVKMMLEKGQPVPEGVVQKILENNACGPRRHWGPNATLRRGVAASVIGDFTN